MREDSPNQSAPVILLYNLAQAALIIRRATGVVYQAQTGGHACAQRQSEGALVPLVDVPLDTRTCPLAHDLAQLGWGPILGISEDRADQIDSILRRYAPTQGLRVDRSRLSESEEAWIYVTVVPHSAADFSGFAEGEGILTWPNSD